MRLYKQQYLILIIIDLDWRMIFSVYPFSSYTSTPILRARSAMYKWSPSRIFHAASATHTRPWSAAYELLLPVAPIVNS